MPTMSGLLDIRQIIIQFPFNRFVLRAERKSETFANAITVDRSHLLPDIRNILRSVRLHERRQFATFRKTIRARYIVKEHR